MQKLINQIEVLLPDPKILKAHTDSLFVANDPDGAAFELHRTRNSWNPNDQTDGSLKLPRGSLSIAVSYIGATKAHVLDEGLRFLKELRGLLNGETGRKGDVSPRVASTVLMDTALFPLDSLLGEVIRNNFFKKRSDRPSIPSSSGTERFPHTCGKTKREDFFLSHTPYVLHMALYVKPNVYQDFLEKAADNCSKVICTT